VKKPTKNSLFGELVYMNASNSNHIWGQDVERLVHWIPSTNERKILKAETIIPGKSTMRIEQKNKSYTGKIQTIKLSGQDGYEKGDYINIETPEGKMLTIPCHLESIPYGFDEPERYELIIDEDIMKIEIL
jgi:hypothetical protein